MCTSTCENASIVRTLFDLFLNYQFPVLQNTTFSSPPVLSGVLQDPSLDGERLLLTDQAGATSGISVSATPSSKAVIHVGAQSDDVCAINNPCLNGGTCNNKDFQDYECNCTGLEYGGRNCEKRDPCGRVKDICAADMECVGVNTDGDASNGDEGYYCE